MSFVPSCTHFFITVTRTFFQSSTLTAKLKRNMSKRSLIVSREKKQWKKASASGKWNINTLKQKEVTSTNSYGHRKGATALPVVSDWGILSKNTVKDRVELWINSVTELQQSQSSFKIKNKNKNHHCGIRKPTHSQIKALLDFVLELTLTWMLPTRTPRAQHRGWPWAEQLIAAAPNHVERPL